MHVRAFDRSIRQDLKQLVAEVQHKYPQLVPGLAIVQVGGRDDSNVYIRMKIRAAAEIGITAQHIQLPRTVTQSELLAKVRNQCSLLKFLHAKIRFHFFNFYFFTFAPLTLQLDELNNDPNVHGIIVQMPLDCDEKIDSDLVTDYVSAEKDVDGLVFELYSCREQIVMTLFRLIIRLLHTT